jgi:hypothetical protein
MAGRCSASLVALLATLVGCQGDNKTPDEVCRELKDRWSSLVQPLSRACGADGDCVLAGGVPAPSGAWLAPIAWDGLPVSADEYFQSTAHDIEAQWLRQGCGDQLSDPLCQSDVGCAEGQCTKVETPARCWGSGMDAGVPDGGGADDSGLDAGGAADAPGDAGTD